MSDLFGEIRAAIPANKFYPPRLGLKSSILRSGLLESLNRKNSSHNAIIIEAQAGQGKTTFALQLLEQSDRPYSWFQTGVEDRDPVLFLTSILACIKKQLKKFKCPTFEQMVASGELSTIELPRLVNVLLNDLDTHLTEEFCLVFDDLHIINSCEQCLELLNLLLTTAPPQLHFILISRTPVILGNKNIKYRHDTATVNNKQLEFSHTETAILINQVLKIPTSWQTIDTLQQKTHGWVMGLRIAARFLEEEHGANGFIRAECDCFASDDLLSYFREEIFKYVPEKSYKNLLILSVLEDIQVDLAIELTGTPDVADQLVSLQQSNLFVRSLDSNNLHFSFHHLFRDFLSQKAQQELSQDELHAILQKTARYFLKKGRRLIALQYFLQAADFDAMESLLRSDGSRFIAENRAITLAKVIRQVPEKIVGKRGWLLFYKAITLSEVEPEKSCTMFDTARAIFTKINDAKGELLSLSHIIYHHFVTTALYDAGAKLLDRAEQMFIEEQKDLTVYEQILVAKNLASGFLFFVYSIEQSTKYSSLAQELARKHNIHNFIAATLLIQGFEKHLLGLRNYEQKEINKAYEMVNSPSVSLFNKLTLHTLMINLLEAHGDFPNYFEQEAQIYKTVGKDIIKQTVVGPYVKIWRLEIFVAQGKLLEAENLYKQSVSHHTETSPHLQSQLLQYYALICSLGNKADEAIQAAKESIRLRDVAGSPFFIIKNQLVVGATYVQLNMIDKAHELFNQVLKFSTARDQDYYSSAAYLHRAYLRLKLDQQALALEDINSGLKLMKKNKFTYFFCWVPKVMIRVLGAAVKNNVESPYARKLAYERLSLAMLEDGSHIPLLDIKILGNFALSLNGIEVLTFRDLTPAQRQLFSLLLSSPKKKISQEKIQLLLWPDSPPEKTRAKFDTLLTRLRKTLSKSLKPYKISNYLTLKKGILALENCRSDADEFSQKCYWGLHHAKRGEWWQAGNCFSPALKLWNGCFATDIFGNDEAQTYCTELRKLFTEVSARWAEHLAGINRTDEAVTILKRALKFDDTNDETYRLLHKYKLAAGNPLKADQVLVQYRTVLRRMELPEAEISETLEKIIKCA